MRSRAAAAARRLDDEHISFGLLLLAAGASIGLGLWLTRGGTFIIDEYSFFSEASGLSPRDLADPFGGHLVAIDRLMYAVYLRLFGSSHLPFQLTTLLVNVGVALLLFRLLARTVGAFAALGAALAVLFLGSTPVGIQGNAAMWGQASLFGLAGYVALAAHGRRSDLIACVAFVLAVLSLEVGVAFTVGAVVWIAIEDRSPRRWWVPGIPLLLYAAWWVWALQFDEGFTSSSNLLLVPGFAADSAAAAVAAFLGLGIDLADGASLSTTAIGWGRVLVPAVLVVIALGVRRRAPSPAWWASLAFLAVFWTATALGFGPLRGPDATRYAFVVIIGLLMLTAASLEGARPRGGAKLAIALAVVFSLGGNLWLLRERGASIRSISELNQARLAVVDLHPEGATRGLEQSIAMPAPPADYLRAAAEFGSLGLAVEELGTMDAAQAAEADRTLGSIAPPVASETRGPCRVERRDLGSMELPPGGIVLRSEHDASLTARRFAAEFSVEVGALPADRPTRVTAPADAAPQPWVVSAAPGTFVVCAAPSG